MRALKSLFITLSLFVTRIIYVRRIIPRKKFLATQLRMTQNFTLWFCPKCIGFQYFHFSKTIRYELRDSRNIQGFALIASSLVLI